MDPLAIFLSWGVLMGDCAGEIAVHGPLAIFPSWGVLMGHCAGKIAVEGPPGYFSFVGCANGPLRMGNNCI
jgi:hypothetical protein